MPFLVSKKITNLSTNKWSFVPLLFFCILSVLKATPDCFGQAQCSHIGCSHWNLCELCGFECSSQWWYHHSEPVLDGANYKLLYDFDICTDVLGALPGKTVKNFELLQLMKFMLVGYRRPVLLRTELKLRKPLSLSSSS